MAQVFIATVDIDGNWQTRRSVWQKLIQPRIVSVTTTQQFKKLEIAVLAADQADFDQFIISQVATIHRVTQTTFQRVITA